MAKLPIILLADPLLRRKSDPIERVDADLGRLIDDMLETMYDAPGIGLAAVQVAVPRRLLVLDLADTEEGEEPKPIVMINPKIVKLGSEMKMYEEGCLSIPDVRIEIERPSTLTVEFMDRKGAAQTLDADGLLATAIQHEVDHLDGKMIVDFLSKLKRDMIIRRFRKMARSEIA